MPMKKFDHGIVIADDLSMAWFDDGARSWPIYEDERANIPVDEYAKMIALKRENKIFRCTSCKLEFPDSAIGGRPLFAGIVCKPCWEKHLAHLEDQRKKGHVCRFCGQPYDNCCC